MTLKFVTITASVLFAAAPALAQANSVKPINTDKEAKALIGAPLNPAGSGGSIDSGKAQTLFFLEGNTVKQAGEWTEADRKACSDAGGVELPISAGRVACIRL